MNRNCPTLFAALTLLLSCGTPAFSSETALPSGMKEVRTVEGVHEYRLENGLQVLLFPDPSKPTLTVNVTYLVGSRFENYGETGMAHLLEHLMFKGTPSHPNIPEEFKVRAARFNGTTWLDRTNYFESVPATEENLKWALGLEADRMINSFIARKDLDSEMTVVRNEYEMGENRPTEVLEKRMQSIAFDWHSYGRSTIGNRSDIENVGIPNLQAFYRNYYQPDNAVLVVTGKFDPAVALTTIQNTFAKIPKPARVLPPFWTVEPTQDGERSFVVRRKDNTVLVWVAYKIPSELAPDSVAGELGGRILGDEPAGRLHKALVETGKASSVSSFDLGGYAPGIRIFSAELKKGDPIEPVRDTIIAQVEGFAKHPPTAQELDRVKVATRNEIQKTLDDPEKFGVEISESIALGDWRLFFKQRDDLDAVTPEQVAKAAAKYYLRDNRTVGIYQPEETPHRAEIAAAPSAEEVLKDYHPKAEASLGETFDPTPANIEARTQFETIGGLKVAFLPKKNRGETVSVAIDLNYGDLKSIFGKKEILRMTEKMLERGTTKMTREQISDAWEKNQMSGDRSRFQTTRSHLADSIRLIAQVYRDASFPAKEFDQLKKEKLTELTTWASNPGIVARRVLGKHFNHVPRGDWNYCESLEEETEDLKKVTREDLVKFHRDFYGASNGQLVIVGDFDPAEAKQVIEKEFGGWKARQPFSPWVDKYTEVAAANLFAPLPDKENALLTGRLNVDMKDDAPDYPALKVADFILGGDSMSSRFGDRLREKEGVSYSVYSYLQVSDLDNAGQWQVHATAAPQNLSKAEAGIREELARAFKEGFTEAEVKSAIEGILKERAQDRAQDSLVAARWSSLLFDGRHYGHWEQKLEDQIAAVTVDSANAALRKYLDPAKLTLAIAADPAKKK